MPETLTPEIADSRVLALFDQAGAVETPSPGTRAWLARDATTGTPVLVKRLRTEAGKARATTALHLSHPNIVRTRRWLSEGGNLYVVRDVVRGRNLKQALSALSFKQTPELLEKLLLPLISALETAHGRGVPHGGVSAENVLIADDGRVLLSDFAIADPAAPQHAPTYGGAATVLGDIKALGKLLIRYLPTGGAFASDAVRERVAGIIERCDSLADLRETVAALDKMAVAPLPKPNAAQVISREMPAAPVLVGPPPLPMDAEDDTPVGAVTIDESPTNPAEWVKRTPTAGAVETPVKPGAARLVWRSANPAAIRVPRGGGSGATLILTNEGGETLLVRMIATQHAWLNVRPMELPLTLPAGASAPIEFSVSAARLSPGDYRSEVYLSANAGGNNAEDLRGGWFKHTADVRITVEESGPVTTTGRPGAGEKPPYPTNAPKIPAPAGCGLLVVMGAGSIVSGLLWGIRLLLS